MLRSLCSIAIVAVCFISGPLALRSQESGMNARWNELTNAPMAADRPTPDTAALSACGRGLVARGEPSAEFSPANIRAAGALPGGPGGKLQPVS